MKKLLRSACLVTSHSLQPHGQAQSLIDLENSAMVTGLKKISFHSNSKERQCQRLLHSSHMLAKQCSKFSKPGFNSRTSTENSQMFRVDLEKAEEAEIKLPTSTGASKRQESFRKTSTSASFTALKPLTV